MVDMSSERKYSTIMVERITGHDKIGLNINMTVHDYGCHSLFLKVPRLALMAMLNF